MSIVRRLEEQTVKEVAGAQGGEGVMISRCLINDNSDIWDQGRLFNVVTLNKDCEVGYHIHNGDGEAYYILEGEAEYNDNGEVTVLKAGDVTFTGPGEGHGIRNLKDEPLRFVAVILFV